MPHTRLARLRALKEAAEYRDLLQIHDTSTNAQWDDCLDWSLPALTYDSDPLTWQPSERKMDGQLPFFSDARSFTADAAAGLINHDRGSAVHTHFDGLQHWYSTGTQDLSSVPPAANNPPKLTRSTHSSYDSSKVGEGSQPEEQTNSEKMRSHKISGQPSAPRLAIHSQRKSDGQTTEPREEVDEPTTSPSTGEHERIVTPKLDASKRRKVTHSIIERNYRSRINDGMAELKECLPLIVKDRSPDDLGRLAAVDAAQSHSSGKVAILSDATRYVKALKLENEALCGQLDVMHRRNNTLQQIALSKINTLTATKRVFSEDYDHEDSDGERAAEEAERVRSMKRRVRP